MIAALKTRGMNFSGRSAALALVLALSAPFHALAAGDSSTTETTTEAPAVAAKCKTGEVWDPEAKGWFGAKGKCVAAAEVQKPKDEKQGMIYDYGRTLAKAGEYDRAIDALRLAPDQSDPRVLNYLGFSHRKLGRMDEALGYYRAAVAANPDYSLVREYLGEAYIQLGALEAAREQLSEIERICGGRTCAEYDQLAKLIVDSQTVGN